MEVGMEVGVEAGTEVGLEVGVEVAMEVAGEDAPGEVVEPSPRSPTVAGARKMRRLRKVRETEIKESEAVDEVGVVSEKRSDVKGHQETAEEILSGLERARMKVRRGKLCRVVSWPLWWIWLSR
jgi:hypothetical protein